MASHPPMGHDTVRCDMCGAVSPNPSRDGMTCNASAPGGGYCQGTMHNPAWHAEQKAAEPKPLYPPLGDGASSLAGFVAEGTMTISQANETWMRQEARRVAEEAKPKKGKK